MHKMSALPTYSVLVRASDSVVTATIARFSSHTCIFIIAIIVKYYCYYYRYASAFQLATAVKLKDATVYLSTLIRRKTLLVKMPKYH